MKIHGFYDAKKSFENYHISRFKGIYNVIKGIKILTDILYDVPLLSFK